MIGQQLSARSQIFLRGYRAGFRANPHPYRWARIWTVLAFLLFAVTAGACWAAWDIALQNTSIGEVVAQTKIGKVAAWIRIHGPTHRGPR